MSPLEIEILMHYHTRGDDYPGAEPISKLPPSQQSAFVFFLENDLLRDTHEGEGDLAEGAPRYRGTERCHVYCAALTFVQLPEQRWVVPEVRA